MSLVTQVGSLATRVAEEFNLVRTEIANLEVLNNIDGGGPTDAFPAGSTLVDGGGP